MDCAFFHLEMGFGNIFLDERTELDIHLPGHPPDANQLVKRNGIFGTAEQFHGKVMRCIMTSAFRSLKEIVEGAAAAEFQFIVDEITMNNEDFCEVAEHKNGSLLLQAIVRRLTKLCEENFAIVFVEDDLAKLNDTLSTFG